MKKYFIIAIAALVASAACTKTEVESFTPDSPISFQVAKYASQTKAPTSLKDEGFTSFKTYAWYTSTVSANQVFMAPATVEYSSANSWWAPTDRVYYWPKTGYINFFSFAGNHLPDAVDLNATSKNAEAHYTTAITVATDDNILVADGAYGFYSNTNPATYGHDGVSQGVPTLFRHMLSKVYFDVKMDATTDGSGVAITDDNNNWEVTVDSAFVYYRNQGTLEVAYGAPSTTIVFGDDNKPTAATANQTRKYVSAAWTPADVANVTLEKVSSTVTTNANGGSASTPVKLIEESVVMPQTLAMTNVTVRLKYTLTHRYNGTNPVTEIVPVTATALTSFTPTIESWNPNTKYIYHIVIKPNGTILFDPAVEEWATPVEASHEF